MEENITGVILLTEENIKEFTTETLLNSLPPRYIEHPFDKLMELCIKRVKWKNQLQWRVGYYNESGINQSTKKRLREAVVDLITRMIKSNTTSFEFIIFND